MTPADNKAPHIQTRPNLLEMLLLLAFTVCYVIGASPIKGGVVLALAFGLCSAGLFLSFMVKAFRNMIAGIRRGPVLKGIRYFNIYLGLSLIALRFVFLLQNWPGGHFVLMLAFLILAFHFLGFAFVDVFTYTWDKDRLRAWVSFVAHLLFCLSCFALIFWHQGWPGVGMLIMFSFFPLVGLLVILAILYIRTPVEHQRKWLALIWITMLLLGTFLFNRYDSYSGKLRFEKRILKDDYYQELLKECEHNDSACVKAQVYRDWARQDGKYRSLLAGCANGGDCDSFYYYRNEMIKLLGVKDE